MHDPAHTVSRTQHFDDRLVRVARVHHDRLVELTGELEVPAEVAFLDLARRVVLEEIEPRFADRDAFRSLAKLADRLPRGFVRIGGVVGVDARRGVEARPPGTQLEGRARSLEVRADQNHAPDPGLSRTFEDRLAIGVERVPKDVGVGVGDQKQCFSSMSARNRMKSSSDSRSATRSRIAQACSFGRPSRIACAALRRW